VTEKGIVYAGGEAIAIQSMTSNLENLSRRGVFMEERFEVLDSMLDNLKQASKLIDRVTRDCDRLEDELDRSSFLLTAAKTLTYIYELQFDLFDLEPELAFEHLLPSLSPVNLKDSLERLRSFDPDIYKQTIRELQSHMTEDEAIAFAEICNSGNGYNYAKAWWERQPKPYIPVVGVYKKLRHPRRYVRYHSAKLLEEVFEVCLWDEERDDVCLEKSDRWFAQWYKSQPR